jgi:asparagine synthase (glutamine-hydrolysing)
MCGIVGQFSFDRDHPVGDASLRRMCDTIVHRGPDDEGIFACGPVGLGMRRLSIIDLAGGHQPMRTDDGALTIVFNGEIYNHRDVRRTLEGRGVRFRTSSDTESILYAYQEYGVDCLEHLNGMFGFAIWDANRRRLFVARDRVGVKPLYWSQNGQRLLFGSEIKALLVDPEVPRTLDRDAMRYFLRYGYVPSPATLFASVRQLPPAHYLLADESGVIVNRYWSLPHASGRERPEAEHVEMVYEQVKRAVDRQLISDVPLGAFLSGGLDSSSMVHMMAEVTGGPISTYSIGFAGVDTFHNELDDARFVSQHYRTSHHEIIVRPDVASLLPRLVHHLDQPIADSSFVVTYLVSALARETVKVIISGVGGDELFGGYRRYLGPYLNQYYDVLPKPVQQAFGALSARLPVDRGSSAKNYFRLARAFVKAHGLPAYERYDEAVQLLSPDAVQTLSPTLPGGESPLIEARRAFFHEAPGDDPLAQMLRLDFHTSLVDSLLQLTDKMSMATSLEARVPLLDHELIEAVTTVPSALKINRGHLRSVQKKSMKGRLPDRVLGKKKRGFGCPVGAWFRTDLKDLVHETLHPSVLARDGIFDPETVQTIISEHEQYREDRTDLLLALVTFQLWRDEWKAA